jgi:hypothetical protein
MTARKFWLGSNGPYLFDDSNTFADGSDHGLATDKPSVDDNDVFRRGDLSTVLINDLSDVVITGTPADNEILAYDTGTSKWINQTAAEAGIVDWTAAAENFDTSGTGRFGSHLEIDGNLNHDGSAIGFFGTGPSIKQTVTGSKAGNAALASLITRLVNYGLVVDSTT